MSLGTAVELVVLAALAVLFLLTLRRMGVLVRRTHDLERYQRMASQLQHRLGATADPFVSQLDELRRHSGDPRSLAERLPLLQDALRAIAAEARSASVPRGLAREAHAFVVELERAVRAAETVGHGLDALLADRGGRDLEGQTSLKRGALNLRHAREAATRIASDIAGLRPADLLARANMPGGSAGAVGTYIVDGDLDADGR